MRRKKRSQRREEREERELAALEARVHEALRADGLMVPRTEDEVRRAEAELARDPVELPEALKEPPEIGAPADAGGGHALEPTRLRGPARIYDDMARAAREGRSIPAEIEEVLRRDREAAERETDGANADDEDPRAETQA